MKMAHEVISIYRLVTKLLIEVNVEKVRGNQMMARECYFAVVNRKPKAKEIFTVSLKI